MNRGILIKLIVILLVAGLVHSVFWFYKAGQVEKQITNYIAENNSYVLAGQIKVTGFPFWQKVTVNDLKFTLPNPAFAKYQIVVKQVEANSGIFDNNFVANVVGGVQLQDQEGNMSSVEFNQQPQINFVIENSMIAKITYQDSGYRVLDNSKNIVYSAASSMVTLESKVDSNDQITGNLKVNVREMTGFDIIDAYKNSSEKRIIDGIKTGEITIGNNSQAGALIKSDAASMVAPTPAVTSATAMENQVMNPAAPAAAKTTTVPAFTPKASKKTDPRVAKTVAAVSAAVAPIIAATPDAAIAIPANPAGSQVVKNPAVSDPSDPSVAAVVKVMQDPTAPIPQVVAPVEEAPLAVVAIPDKNNLIIDIDYTLTPNRNDQQSSTPFDPSQIQELNVQYNKSIKINNLELSNSLYKISIAGQVNTFIDDNMPSGSVTIKVDNMINLVGHIVSRFNEMAKKDEVVEQAQATADNAIIPQVNVSQDAYQGFLKKVAQGLPNIAKELAAKSPMTKDDVAVFELRRDKNLEYIINETPSREVIGKF